MHTNKQKLFKSFKYFAITAFLMFLAPILVYQAFKNTGHALYYPVLILGIITAIGAIGMGFYSIKVILSALFKGK